MAEGSVWFRASIGSRKNAEARWLLPMICRRGGIDKHDIGAIRIMDTTTEFEISERVAESFAVKIRRPDKEDNIRIDVLSDAPQAQAAFERSHGPRREAEAIDRGARRNDKPRDGRPKHHGRPHGESGPGSGQAPAFEKKRRSWDKPAHAGQLAGAPPAKPAFRNKAKKNHRAMP
jgi:ATP-dependent RNA helicase DeaD